MKRESDRERRQQRAEGCSEAPWEGRSEGAHRRARIQLGKTRERSVQGGGQYVITRGKGVRYRIGLGRTLQDISSRTRRSCSESGRGALGHRSRALRHS